MCMLYEFAHSADISVNLLGLGVTLNVPQTLFTVLFINYYLVLCASMEC